MGRLLIISLLFFSITANSTKAKASNESKEFFLSCTYGVIAGTLVGAATLAFSDNPDQNLDRLAKGASLGLYAGILLGVYVVYILPAQLQRQQNEELEKVETSKVWEPPALAVYPTFNYRGSLDGVAAQYRVISF